MVTRCTPPILPGGPRTGRCDGDPVRPTADLAVGTVELRVRQGGVESNRAILAVE